MAKFFILFRSTIAVLFFCCRAWASFFIWVGNKIKKIFFISLVFILSYSENVRTFSISDIIFIIIFWKFFYDLSKIFSSLVFLRSNIKLFSKNPSGKSLNETRASEFAVAIFGSSNFFLSHGCNGFSFFLFFVFWRDYFCYQNLVSCFI